MITIRPYAPEEREAVRNICKADAVERYARTEAHREEICFLFLDYFLDYEPEHAFVAVTEENDVVGYVCGSLNYPLYRQKMHEVYDPKIRRVSFTHFLFNRCVTYFAKRLYQRYGMSLHLNVAPSHQHQKIGPRLLDALKEDGKASGAKGLYLVTKNRKTTGYPFYRHYGFKEARDFLFGSLALVYPL